MTSAVGSSRLGVCRTLHTELQDAVRSGESEKRSAAVTLSVSVRSKYVHAHMCICDCACNLNPFGHSAEQRGDDEEIGGPWGPLSGVCVVPKAGRPVGAAAQKLKGPCDWRSLARAFTRPGLCRAVCSPGTETRGTPASANRAADSWAWKTGSKLVLGTLETWDPPATLRFPSLSLFASTSPCLFHLWAGLLTECGVEEGRARVTASHPSSAGPGGKTKSLLVSGDRDPGKDPNWNSSSHMCNCGPITLAERWVLDHLGLVQGPGA